MKWSPGFDGEYGKVQIFDEEERNGTKGQMDFFGVLGIEEKLKKKEKKQPLKLSQSPKQEKNEGR